MKKLTFILFLAVTTFAMGQDNDEDTTESKVNAKHEFRIDVLESLIAPAVDVSYEYLISKYSGAGISAFVAINNDIGNYQELAITPYFRQYFFNKKEYGARGFFAEGVLQYSSGTSEDFFYDEATDTFFTETPDWNTFGIGFAIGQKWVSKNGFVAEISIGGGRNFSSDSYVPEGFFRGGVSFGYRF